MKRLLFALLAILTGFAATGAPVLAAVETQSSVAAGVAQQGDAVACRSCRVAGVMPHSDLSRRVSSGEPVHAVSGVTSAPAVQLKADRAHE